jgi:P4 family phage/plasmid primase-like protien
MHNDAELIDSQAIANWQFVPVKGKSPAMGGTDWYKKDFTREEIHNLINSKKATGFGVKLGTASNGLMVTDIDGQPAIDYLKTNYPPLPKTVSSTSREGNESHYYIVPKQYWALLKREEIKTGIQYTKADGKETESKIELRWGVMQQVVPPSTHPDTGQPYKWINSPQDTEVAVIPDWLLELMMLKMSPLSLPSQPKAPIPSQPTTPKASNSKPSDMNRAREFLKYIDVSKADGYGDWLSVGMALASVDDTLLPDWIEWSKQSPKFKDENDCEKRWRGATWKKDTLDNAMGKLCNWAKKGGWQPKPKSERKSNKDKQVKPQKLTKADIAKLDGIEIKDEKYFVNLVHLGDRHTKAILQGTAKDIDQDKLIDAYKELRAWENVLLKFAPDTTRYVKALTIMRKLCSERFHMDMHKYFESIPNQASLMPSLYCEGGNDAINESLNRMWKMVITPIFEDDTEGEKVKAFEANELKNLRIRVEILFRSNLKYNIEIKEWYEYKGGLWKRIDVAEVEARSRELLHILTCKDGLMEGNPPTKKQIAEFVNRLEHSVRIAKFDADNEYPDLVNLKDCVLNRKTREVMSHDKKYNFTWQLPYNWSDRHKGCDEIMSWLDWVFEGDNNKIMLMLCFLNAIVTQRSDLQKFMQIIGQGGTGKSTFSIVARALVGIENCRSTQMSALEGNRFEGANLYGKRLLIISEADSYTGDAPMIKNITGGDPIRYEVKGIQSRLDFVFNGKLLIVANKPFEPKEAGSAWYRRVINVPFNREVPLDQKESLLEIQGDRFVGKFEPYIAGLLDKVLSISDEKVREYLEKTSKYVPSLDEHKSEMILYSNPLAQWCDENLVLLPTARTYIGDGKKQSISTEVQGGVRINHIKYEDSDKLLYSNYCQFCTYRGNSPVSLSRFSRNLLELFNGVLKVNTVKKSRDMKGTFIIGLAIRTLDHANIPTPIKKTLLNNVDLMTGNVDFMKTETLASEESVDYVGFF